MAGVRAGFEFAASDPAAAQVLTNDALAHGVEGIDCYERLAAYLREQLEPGREQSPEAERSC